MAKLKICPPLFIKCFLSLVKSGFQLSILKANQRNHYDQSLQIQNNNNDNNNNNNNDNNNNNNEPIATRSKYIIITGVKRGR